jgi:hypothetical protein
MNAFVAWILAAALHFAPPERHPRFDGYEETAEQAHARYEQIAVDIAAAVEGRKDAKDMAALALAWAIGESALAPDADKGPCYRKGRWKLRCDGGLAAGPWQLHEYWDRQAKERVTVAAIFADRARSAKTVVRKLIGAWVQCAHLAPEDRLSGFGLGHCEAGNASVRARYRLWQRVRAWQPPRPPAASSGTMEPKQTRAAVVKASNAIVAIVDLYAGIVAEQDGEVASYKVALGALQQQVDDLKVDLATRDRTTTQLREELLKVQNAEQQARDEASRCKAELVQREDDVVARDALDARLRDLAQSIAKRDEKIEALEQALRLRVLLSVSGKPLLVAGHDGANSFVWQVEADDGNGVLWICDEDAPRWVIELCNVVVDLERRTMKTRGGWRGPCSAMRLQQAAGVVLARQIMVSMVALANASAASSGA